MNVNLKKTAFGIGALFIVFCFAFVLNRILDRSDDDNIIISSETESYSQNTEENTETDINSSKEKTSSSETEENYLKDDNNQNNFYGYLKYEENNGDVYDGYWQNGKYSGKGILTRKSGEIYDGEWLDGAFDKGKITYKINNFGKTETVEIIHVENWNGTGKLTAILDNGEIYNGEWFDSKKNGTGTLYSGNTKRIYTGIWENDVLVEGTETTLYDDGLQTYTVQIKDGFRNGKGILYDEKGNIKKEEQWLDDQMVE